MSTLKHMYPERLLEHFQNPRNVGDLAAPAVTVEASNPACGDILRLAARFKGAWRWKFATRCAGARRPSRPGPRSRNGCGESRAPKWPRSSPRSSMRRWAVCRRLRGTRRRCAPKESGGCWPKAADAAPDQPGIGSARSRSTSEARLASEAVHPLKSPAAALCSMFSRVAAAACAPRLAQAP